MPRYPIAKDFKKIDRPMPYHRLLFPLAGPVQKLMLRCVPLLEGLTVSKESIPGFQGKPVPVELYRPAGSEGITPKKVSRLILQSVAALSKIGISAVVRRSNGKRLIELRRAESDDAQSTQAVDPIDPADVSGGENAPCFGV